MIGLSLPGGPLTVLCLGAHPDDIEIGCGGTLLELGRTRSVSARFAVMTGSRERQEEARKAAESFLPGSEVEFGELPDGRLPEHWGALKEYLESVAARAGSPDLIFCPRRDDAHQDHRLLSEMVPTVWRDSLVLEYEIPKWDGDMGVVTHYVKVSDENVSRKFRLLDEAFVSQRGRYWWNSETFASLSRIRGVESRATNAEAFVVRKATIQF